MSSLEGGEGENGTRGSPLQEVGSPTSVDSELMVTDMLEEHESRLQTDTREGKRKRDTDGEELSPRKLPSLTSNNNDVGFVLGDNTEDGLQNDGDDVSLFLYRDPLIISLEPQPSSIPSLIS